MSGRAGRTRPPGRNGLIGVNPAALLPVLDSGQRPAPPQCGHIVHDTLHAEHGELGKVMDFNNEAAGRVVRYAGRDETGTPARVPAPPAIRAAQTDTTASVPAEWRADGRSVPSLPDYLVRHYGWAYLNPLAVRIFDHQALINAILFGQYNRIMDQTLALIEPESAGRTLQLAAVYGRLIPILASRIPNLHLIDVSPIQLRAARRKLATAGLEATMCVMNVEELDYEDNSFDTAIMFLLLHELPPESRRKALREAVRVLRPGGRLVIAEYGAYGDRHWLHRFRPMRLLLEWVEPFLGGFWREDLPAVAAACGSAAGKSVRCDASTKIFAGFYRVLRFTVD